MNLFVRLLFNDKPTVIQCGDIVSFCMGDPQGSTTNIIMARKGQYLQFIHDDMEDPGGLKLQFPNTLESHCSIIRLLSAVTGLTFKLHSKDSDPINSRWIPE